MKRQRFKKRKPEGERERQTERDCFSIHSHPSEHSSPWS